MDQNGKLELESKCQELEDYASQLNFKLENKETLLEEKEETEKELRCDIEGCNRHIA